MDFLSATFVLFELQEQFSETHLTVGHHLVFWPSIKVSLLSLCPWAKHGLILLFTQLGSSDTKGTMLYVHFEIVRSLANNDFLVTEHLLSVCDTDPCKPKITCQYNGVDALCQFSIGFAWPLHNIPQQLKWEMVQYYVLLLFR